MFIKCVDRGRYSVVTGCQAVWCMDTGEPSRLDCSTELGLTVLLVLTLTVHKDATGKKGMQGVSGQQKVHYSYQGALTVDSDSMLRNTPNKDHDWDSLALDFNTNVRVFAIADSSVLRTSEIKWENWREPGKHQLVYDNLAHCISWLREEPTETRTIQPLAVSSYFSSIWISLFCKSILITIYNKTVMRFPVTHGNYMCAAWGKGYKDIREIGWDFSLISQ